MTRAVLSVPAHSLITDPGVAGWTVQRRPSDWGLPPHRQIPFLARRVREATMAARDADLLVLATAGAEASMVPRRRPRTLTWDLLIPNNRVLLAMARARLHRLDKHLVIRRADADTLVRDFRVPANQVEFVPYPVTLADVATRDDGYAYAAGGAHRDYATMVTAVEGCGARAVISTDGQVPESASVDVRRLLSPAEGRDLLAACSVVVAPLVDTHLPAGPLIVLDALALGKPVIATDVAGNRDYVEHGVTGLLVPPGDASAMTNALRTLLEDDKGRAEMGRAAQEKARSLRLPVLLERIGQI